MTDSFKKTADDYKPAGGRGAFKNRSVGASDVLREMQRQVNPILNAHKRNADSIFSTQLRYLSDLERAQSEEEQSRKVAHKFEMDKMDNVQKWNKDAISKLQEYKTGGYQEIMSKAIKMSEFSHWAQTLVKVGEIVAQTAYKAHTANQARSVARDDLGQTGDFSQGDNINQAPGASDVNIGEAAHGIEDAAKTDHNNTVNRNQVAKGDSSPVTKDDSVALNVGNNTVQTGLLQSNSKTLASFSVVDDRANEILGELMAQNDALKGGEQTPISQLIKDAYTQAAEESGILDNKTRAADKVIAKLLEQRNRRLSFQSDSNFTAALGKGYEIVTKTIQTAETIEDLQNAIDFATTPGSTVINTGDRQGYTSPGRRGDFYVKIYKDLIAVGKFDLAEEFAFHMKPQNADGKPSGHTSHYEQNPTFKAYVMSKRTENKTAEANAKVLERNIKGSQIYAKLLNYEARGEGSLHEALVAAAKGDETLLETWGVNALNELKGYPDQETQLRFFLTENSTNTNYNNSFWEQAKTYADRGQVTELNKMLPNVPQKHKHEFITKYINRANRFGGIYDRNTVAKNRRGLHQSKLKPNGTSWDKGSIQSLEKVVELDMRYIELEMDSLISKGVDPATALDEAIRKVDRMRVEGKDDITSPYWIRPGSDNPDGNHAEYGNLLYHYTAFGGKLPSQIIDKVNQFSNPRAVLVDTENSIGFNTLFDTRVVAEQWKQLEDSNGTATIHFSPEQEIVFREINKGLPTGKKMKRSEFHALVLKNQGYPVDELPVDKWDIVIMGNIDTPGYAEFENKVINGVVPTHRTVTAMAWSREVRDNPNEANVSLGVNPVALKKHKVKNQGVNPFDQNPYGPFRGEWKPNTRVSKTDKPYKVGDVVSHGGQQYVSRATHTSHNMNPSEDTENWRLKEDTRTVDNFNYLESITGVELQFTPKNLRNMPGIDRGDKFWIKGSAKLRDFNSEEVNLGTVLDLDYTLDEDSLFLKER